MDRTEADTVTGLKGPNELALKLLAACGMISGAGFERSARAGLASGVAPHPAYLATEFQNSEGSRVRSRVVRCVLSKRQSLVSFRDRESVAQGACSVFVGGRFASNETPRVVTEFERAQDLNLFARACV